MQKFILTATAALLGLLVVVSASGCNTNPRVDFANAQATYNSVVTQLVTNKDKFDEETWDEKVLPAIEAGDAALDQYDLLTQADLPSDSARETLRQVLVLLSVFLEQIE